MSIGPQVELGNGVHERTWFGVTAAQSAQSSLPQYTAGGGVTDFGAHLNVSYRLSQHVIFRVFADG